MPSPRRLSDEQRQALLARDRQLAREVAGGYRTTHERIRAEIERLTDEIRAAQAAGEQINRSWLIQRQRLTRLDSKVRAELLVWVDFATRRITNAQIREFEQGRTDANQLLRATLADPPPGAHAFEPSLPTAPFEQIVARTAPGTAVGDLLDAIGTQAGEKIRRELVTGVALGHGPREIARAMTRQAAIPATRALVIARTEVIGAYRAATHESLKANAALLDGWVWSANLGPRTCPVCIAMHGTEHPADEPMDSHPACRCAMLPLTKPWSALGFPGVRETRVDVEPGPVWFARQPVELQRAVLGPGKLDAYQSGALTLPDLVARTDSPRFGRGLRERSLADALAA